jgi:hypothetical protein
VSGRIRSIKPELMEDERTAGLSHEAFRLFVGMILLADDHGNLRANPKQLDAVVFWSRESREDLARLLEELARASLVTLYTVRGQPYAALNGWKKHQRVDHPGKPRVPGPSEADRPEPPKPDEKPDSRDSREDLAKPSRGSPETLAPDPDPDPDPDHRSPLGAADDAEPSPSAGGLPPGPDESDEPEADATPRGPRPDSPEPEGGTVARAVFDAIVSDPELRPIVTRPAELAHRLADRQAYGAVDPVAEVKRAGAWLAANQANRKKNGTKFLTNWVGRAQERAPRVAQAGAPTPQRAGAGSQVARINAAIAESKAAAASNVTPLLNLERRHG